MAYVKKELQTDVGDRTAQLYIKGNAAPVKKTKASGCTGKTCVMVEIPEVILRQLVGTYICTNYIDTH